MLVVTQESGTDPRAWAMAGRRMCRPTPSHYSSSSRHDCYIYLYQRSFIYSQFITHLSLQTHMSGCTPLPLLLIFTRCFYHFPIIFSLPLSIRRSPYYLARFHSFRQIATVNVPSHPLWGVWYRRWKEGDVVHCPINFAIPHILLYCIGKDYFTRPIYYIWILVYGINIIEIWIYTAVKSISL
jgi:hypothetical protein